MQYGNYSDPEMEERKLCLSMEPKTVNYLSTAARTNWLFVIIKLDKYAFPIGSKGPF
jgi:hypothetical protein